MDDNAPMAGQTRRVARSAEKLAASADQQTEAADRRTVLAGDRTLLAAERTYAAWVRTALAALASGVGAPALLTGVVPGWLARATGTVLILFAGFCLVAAVWRDLRDGIPPPRPDVKPIPAPLLVALNGFLLLVVLAALVGVWAGDFHHAGVG
jgi:putative membrane protein